MASLGPGLVRVCRTIKGLGQDAQQVGLDVAQTHQRFNALLRTHNSLHSKVHFLQTQCPQIIPVFSQSLFFARIDESSYSPCL